MNTIETIEKWFKKIVEILLAILFAGMIVLVAMQVIGRFINVSMAKQEEMSRYFMVYSVFFGMILLYCERGHVWVNNLVNAVPAPVRRVMLLISYVVQIGFFIAVIYGASILFPTVSMRDSNACHIPLTIVYGCVPVSAAFMIIFAIRDIIFLIQGKEV